MVFQTGHVEIKGSAGIGLASARATVFDMSMFSNEIFNTEKMPYLNTVSPAPAIWSLLSVCYFSIRRAKDSRLPEHHSLFVVLVIKC